VDLVGQVQQLQLQDHQLLTQVVVVVKVDQVQILADLAELVAEEQEEQILVQEQQEQLIVVAVVAQQQVLVFHQQLAVQE
jgi:hypothetical protein